MSLIVAGRRGTKPPCGSIPDYDHSSLNGLVGWWPFLETGGDTAYDMMRLANGTLTGFTLTDARAAGQPRFLGLATVFDGSNDYIAIPDVAAQHLTKFTLSAWVNPSSFADFREIITRCDGPTTNRNYEMDLEITSGKVRMYFTDSVASFRGFTANTGVALGAWTHVTGTFDGATLAVYLNGVADGTSAQAFVPDAATAETLAIGRLGASATNFFSGSMDDVRIYNRALSQGEILELYRNPWQAFETLRTFARGAAAPPPTGRIPWIGFGSGVSGYMIQG